MATIFALLLVAGAFCFLVVARKKRWRRWYDRGSLVGILSPKKSFKETAGEFKHPAQHQDSRDVLRKVK